MGDITGHLSSKRAQIEGMEERGMNKVEPVKVPLSEMFGYVTTLRSYQCQKDSFHQLWNLTTTTSCLLMWLKQ